MARAALLVALLGGAIVAGALLLPPFLREILAVLLKACAVAVACYVVFVVIAMRR